MLTNFYLLFYFTSLKIFTVFSPFEVRYHRLKEKTQQIIEFFY